MVNSNKAYYIYVLGTVCLISSPPHLAARAYRAAVRLMLPRTHLHFIFVTNIARFRGTIYLQPFSVERDKNGTVTPLECLCARYIYAFPRVKRCVFCVPTQSTKCPTPGISAINMLVLEFFLGRKTIVQLCVFFFSIGKLIAFPILLRSTCCFVRAMLDLLPPWKEFDSRTESTSIWMRKIFRRKMYIRTPFLLFRRARLLLLFVESQRQFTNESFSKQEIPWFGCVFCCRWCCEWKNCTKKKKRTKNNAFTPFTHNDGPIKMFRAFVFASSIEAIEIIDSYF